MCRIKNIAIQLLLGVLFAQPLLAQFKLLEPTLIGKEQGLPTNNIRAILKGNDGFIWLGTSEGLCRFDGQQVRVFKPGDLQNPIGATNSVFTLLSIDDKIWMGTSQGVSILNTSDETFRHFFFRGDADPLEQDSLQHLFYEPVAVLYRDRQGIVWAGTRNKGLWHFDSLKNTFIRTPYPDSAYHRIVPTLGSEYSVLSIEQSRTNDSIIWAGTTAGLEEVNKYSGEVHWYTYPHPEKDHQVSLNVFRKLYYHDDGKLYTGSWGAGTNVFDPVTKILTPLEVKPGPGMKALKGSIASLFRKSENEIWISTSSGLVVYNTQRKEITWFWLNDARENRDFGIDYIDDANRIWLITINGVQYFDGVTQQFNETSFSHLFKNRWGFNFYIKSDPAGQVITVCPRVADGLYRLDRRTGDWTRLPFLGLEKFDPDQLIVRGFEEVSPGEYLISTDQALYAYSTRSRQLRLAPGQPEISYHRWGDILKDHNGTVWISADAEGLIRWDRGKNKYRIFKKELTNDGSGMGFGRPANMFEDSHHNIWFSRVGGFSVYLAANDSVVNFIYNENTRRSFPGVYDFAEDRTGKIWVNAANGWYGYAERDHPANGIVRKYNLKEKNIDGSLISLASDQAGNAWGYTHQVLVRINSADQSLSTFSFDYGVKNPDFYHFSFLPTGEIIFGGRTSVTLADVDELKRNTETPVPYIARLNLMNRALSPSSLRGPLHLNYQQNFLTVFFSAKAYTMPQGVRFRYRLKNFDEWTTVEGAQSANYTNIPPGEYVFQLQAANNEGIWNREMLELPMEIGTPWWQTWWFRGLALVFVVGVAYWFYRFRIDQIKKKEKLKTQYEKKLANVEMSALLAQMNPHFLFNSLNSIDSYIIKNESGKASEYLNNFARLMRLILQNSRSNYISLKDELEALDLYLQMESLRFKDKFCYEINVDEKLDTGSIVIPPMLIQPYVENAIWHGLMHKKDGATGKVCIAVRQRDHNLVCLIEDNGIGRERAAEIKAKKPGNHKRSMGMQITRDRIEMINKLYNTNTRVEVIDLKKEDDQPAGTRVELIIPF